MWKAEADGFLASVPDGVLVRREAGPWTELGSTESDQAALDELAASDPEQAR